MKIIKENEQKVEKEKKILKCIPVFAIMPIIITFIIYIAVYEGAIFFCESSGAVKFDLTTSFDRSVPFLSEWILIYVLSYLVWVVGFIVISNLGRKDFYRFITTTIISVIVGGIIFVSF